MSEKCPQKIAANRRKSCWGWGDGGGVGGGVGGRHKQAMSGDSLCFFSTTVGAALGRGCGEAVVGCGPVVGEHTRRL